MEISNQTKLVVLISLLTVFVLGVSIGGPKFIHKIQMHFGFKGKIDLIEECIAMPGCAISTNELEMYTNYKALQESEVVQEFKETDLAEDLEEEERKSK
jgi:hypothetical protein